jgi:hypothetical protein
MRFENLKRYAQSLMHLLDQWTSPFCLPQANSARSLLARYM